MTISVRELRNYEKSNTLIDILKKWACVDTVRQVVDILNDPTESFVEDAAYSANVSVRLARESLIKNLDKQVKFEVIDEHDFNTGCPSCKITVDGIEFWTDWC